MNIDRIVKVVIMPIEQPPEGYNKLGEIDVNTVAFTDGLDDFDSYIDIPLPLPLGSKVGVRERWNYDDYTFEYKYEDSDPIPFQGYWNMKPASTMPDEAVRKLLSVSHIAVKQVKELTGEELEYLPYMRDRVNLDSNFWVEVAGLREA